MKIRILTDSASDLTPEELDSHQVGLIPMPVLCGDKTYMDDKTIPMETFWEMLFQGISVKTSQPSPDAFIHAFEAAKKAGEAAICIVISSALSGTFQCALMARQMVGYEHIHVIDAGKAAAAAAEKMLVLEACRLRDTGRYSAAEIAEQLEQFRSRVRLIACLDTLEYLARGGRLPKTVAGLGTALKVKPIITLSPQGEIAVCKKVVGFQRAMREMVAFAQSFSVDTSYPLIPIFAHTQQNCQMFLDHLQQAGFSHPTQVPETIGATIGTYIGPGGYGLVFVEQENA